MPTTTLKQILAGMNRPKRGLQYYQLLLTGTPTGLIEHATCTHWVGFSTSKPRMEIRRASLVKPKWWMNTWKKLGVPYVIVNTLAQLLVFRGVGGFALVEKQLGEDFFADVICEAQVARDAPLGFRTLNGVARESLNRAPSRKLRMSVLARDGYRCRLCGRRAADYTDVELHVHHILPWATGALTLESNLITLCNSCHTGLSPHEDIGLFELLNRRGKILPNYTRDLMDGIRRYQAVVQPIHEKARSRRMTR